MQQLPLGSERHAARILAGLDPDQCAVVEHDTGPACVTATPGSGKTHAVVHRIAYLVDVRGVDPARIFAVTFTKKAAGVMNDRLATLIGADRATVKTFHALAYAVCRKHFPDFKAWSEQIAYADAMYERWVADAIGRKNKKFEFGEEHLDWHGAETSVLLEWIALCKANAWAPWSDEALAFARAQRSPSWWDPALANDAYDLAERKRIAKRRMTFADMLIAADTLLEDDAIARAWATKWLHVIVDEGQDNSRVQSRLVTKIAGCGNVMLVGDDQQAIYRFAGASPDLFRAFATDHGATVLPLRYNYRSAQCIVQAGNLIAEGMADRDGREPMVAVRPEPGVLTIDVHASPEAEALGVVAEVRASHAAGLAWRDHYVLYRTRSMSRACEDALAQAAVPYCVLGGVPFYERHDAKVLIAYLRLARGHGTADDAVLSLKHPKRFLPNTFFDALRGYDGSWSQRAAAAAAADPRRQRDNQSSVEEWVDLITGLRAQALAGEPTAKLLEAIVARTRYMRELESETGRETLENDRKSDVLETIHAASIFPTIDGFLAHVQQATEASREASSPAAQAEDRVTLMTCHKSKGLEAPVVFVIGCNDRVMPHVLNKDLGEERRLAFVAFTRARDRLHVSYISGGSPSRYLDDIAPAATRMALVNEEYESYAALPAAPPRPIPSLLEKLLAPRG
jgi:DNA helicase-2/ATP-dependent DNA helicase PcrA